MLTTRWTAPDPEGLRNVHERTVAATMSSQGDLLERLAAPDGPWPSDRWWPLVLDAGLTVGSRGGHGPVRYLVEAHEAGRSIRFRLAAGMPFQGWHRFDLVDVPGGVCWRHTLVVSDSLTVRAAVIPLHDALIEDLLDDVASLARGGTRGASRRPLTAVQVVQRQLAVLISRRPLPSSAPRGAAGARAEARR